VPSIGETIGSYQVLKQLGAGAMGEVYLAEHRHLKRKAAPHRRPAIPRPPATRLPSKACGVRI